jgi:hypothetical protein
MLPSGEKSKRPVPVARCTDGYTRPCPPEVKLVLGSQASVSAEGLAIVASSEHIINLPHDSLTPLNRSRDPGVGSGPAWWTAEQVVYCLQGDAPLGVNGE